MDTCEVTEELDKLLITKTDSSNASISEEPQSSFVLASIVPKNLTIKHEEPPLEPLKVPKEATLVEQKRRGKKKSDFKAYVEGQKEKMNEIDETIKMLKETKSKDRDKVKTTLKQKRSQKQACK